MTKTVKKLVLKMRTVLWLDTLPGIEMKLLSKIVGGGLGGSDSGGGVLVKSIYKTRVSKIG